MIVTLNPRSEFAPVPYVEIRIDESSDWDGGDPDDAGGGTLDGGTPTGGSPLLDGGTPATISIDVPAETDNITVWWSSEGRSDKVAGAVRRAFGGSFGHQDVEAGFDVETAYELECFEGTRSIARLPMGSVVLPWAGEQNECLIQQPLNPYLNATVTNLSGSWPDLTWDTPGELVGVQGSTYPSLISSGPIQGASGVQVDFGAPTRESSRRVKATLGTQDAPQLPVWLIRSHQGMLPRRFYAHVKPLREVDVTVRLGGGWSRFLTTVTEVARPAPGLQISPLSYDDLDVSFADYDDRDAAYATYDDMDTDWTLAGAGG